MSINYNKKYTCCICGRTMEIIETPIDNIVMADPQFVYFDITLICFCGNKEYTGQDKRLKILKPKGV